MSTLAISWQSLLAVLFLAQVFVAASAPAFAQSNVDGRNVTVIEFGRKLGELRQTGPGQWVETNAAGQVAFRFEETKRDDSSVYLLDRSRNVTLQLDLKTRKVMYSAGGAPPSELYAVLSAAATPGVAPAPAASATPGAPAGATAGAPGGATLCQFNTGMHVVTFDSARFDVSAGGVLSLVESDALTVQVRRDRLWPAIPDARRQLVTAVALRVGATVYTFDTLGPSLKSATSAGVTVSTTGSSGEMAAFRMQDGSLVSIAKFPYYAYNITVSVPASAKGKVRGICGNFDGNEKNDNPSGTNLATTWVVPDNRNLFVCGASCAGYK
ncbi:MAG: VWD domain-containing protein [Sulfuritalea sp.]|nr:VWD domain-containing protein [Sulfuritalea sp.]